MEHALELVYASWLNAVRWCACAITLNIRVIFTALLPRDNKAGPGGSAALQADMTAESSVTMCSSDAILCR